MRNILTLSCVKWSWSTPLTRPRPQCRHCSGSASDVRLQCDDYNDHTDPSLAPLVISHGMLGSRHNWTSIAKQLHKSSGRRQSLSLCSDIIYISTFYIFTIYMYLNVISEKKSCLNNWCYRSRWFLFKWIIIMTFINISYCGRCRVAVCCVVRGKCLTTFFLVSSVKPVVRQTIGKRPPFMC